jgi:xylulokinase
MSNILTFDVGTTSVKTCLFDQEFHVLASHSSEYQLITAAGGIVEMNPQSYWQAVCAGARAVLGIVPQAKNSVSVITITTQGETLIPVDKAGEALCNAIVWLDNRASQEALQLAGEFTPDKYYPVTGLGQVDEAAPISKILYLKNNKADIYQNTYKFLLLEDYLIFRLTGELVSEKSLMSSTGYFNIITDKMFTSILDYAEIPLTKFPEVLDCGQAVGKITARAASELGISAHTQIVAGAMDQLAGALGSGNFDSGIVTEITGTALVMGATTLAPDFSHPARPTIYRHVEKGRYLIVPWSITAGVILKWFKDEFCRQESIEYGERVYEALDAMAQRVPPGSEGLVVFPYFSGMLTPVNDMTTRGIFYGVSLNTRKQHFVRAIFESVAFMLRENIDILQQMNIDVKQIHSLGGGSRSSVWSQIKADVLKKQIVTMRNSECTSLGAAYLGALGSGLGGSLAAMSRLNPTDQTYEPDLSNTDTYDRQYRLYQKLYQCHLELSR